MEAVKQAAVKAWEKAKNITKIKIKKPWQITGPCSSPEYVEALPNATEYRVFCPATPPAGLVPQVMDCEPDRVFDICYYPRDAKSLKVEFPHKFRYRVNKQQALLLSSRLSRSSEFYNAIAGSSAFHLRMKTVDPDQEPGGGYQK